MTKSAGKWDPETKEYDFYVLPKGSSLYEYDMDKVINCAGCGNEATYGQSYTSMLIHNSVGFGYMVCPVCWKKETEIKSIEIRKEVEEKFKEDTLDRVADNRELW